MQLIRKCFQNQSSKGFSIIEVLVVVAIMAILMLLMLPRFRDQTLEANRQAAHTAMTDTSQALERYYANNQTFVGFPNTSTVSQNNLYNIVVRTATTTGYVIEATPNGNQTNDTIGAFRLNQAGLQQHSLKTSPNNFIVGWKD